MANNGKMIVYDKSKTTGAMAEAMGLLDKPKGTQNKRVNKDNSNFRSGKNTPAPIATQPNVNYKDKEGGKNKMVVWKPRQRVLSPEEKREKDIKLTLDALEAMMIEAGDEFTKMKGRNYRVKTGVLDPYGGEVIIRVYQDDNDASDIITIFDDDGVFNDFVAEHNSERAVWDEIRRFCLRKRFFSLRGIHSNINGNPECYLQIKGKVEDYVKMKWQLLDPLKMIYDEDKELREACGL